MSRRFTPLGVLKLLNGACIRVYVKSEANPNEQSILLLKLKLKRLLKDQFVYDEEYDSPLISLDGLTSLWNCHRITVLRLMRRGHLHPVDVDGEMFFDRSEVTSLTTRNIAVYPHLTVARKPSARSSKSRSERNHGSSSE
jgi:hypothetical protein